MNTIQEPKDDSARLTPEQMLEELRKAEQCLPSPIPDNDWEVADPEDLDGEEGIWNYNFQIVGRYETRTWKSLRGEHQQNVFGFEVEFIGEDYFGPCFDEHYTSIADAVFAIWVAYKKDEYRNKQEAQSLAEAHANK